MFLPEVCGISVDLYIAGWVHGSTDFMSSAV